MDERQFNYLQEMEIPLWISREAHEVNAPQEGQGEISCQAETAHSSTKVESQSVEPLTEQQQPLVEVSPDKQAEPLLEEGVTKEVYLDWNSLQRVVSECQLCPELVSNRSQTVFGTGNPQADWLIVGEVSGAEEDPQGEPVVSSAGQLLNAMLLAVGLRRSQVYITNILKCHTPHNHDPQPSEIAACRGYLQRQIDLIQPKVILAVGSIAAQMLLNSDDSVDKLRGKVHKFESGSGAELPLVVTYHPAYLLRVPQEKAKSWHDLKLALNSLGR